MDRTKPRGVYTTGWLLSCVFSSLGSQCCALRPLPRASAAECRSSAWSLPTPRQHHRGRDSTLGGQSTPLFATSIELVGQLGRISRYARTSPHPPAHSLHEIACVNSLAAGYAAPGRARVLKQLGGARGTSGSRRCECGVWAGHQSCPISSASGSKGAVGIICRCRYSVCLSTTHNTPRCTHHGCRDVVWVGSRDAAPLLVYWARDTSVGSPL